MQTNVNAAVSPSHYCPLLALTGQWAAQCARPWWWFAADETDWMPPESRALSVRLSAVLVWGVLSGPGLWSFVAFGQDQPATRPAAALHVIELLAARNPPLDLRAGLLVVPDSIGDERHQKLRAYAKDLAGGTRDDELSRLLRISAWVHQRIQHDNFNAAPAQATALDILNRAARGEHFSCVEFSRVLKETLAAFGYVARTLSVQSPAVAYGPLGSGHVASEVWSNALDKWVFVDAQWGVYARLDARPLSFYELYRLKQDGRFNDVRFVSLNASAQHDEPAARAHQEEYRHFIANYFGYLSVRYTQAEQVANLVLPLDGAALALTFQGLGRSGQLFTTEPRDHYFTLNHTNILLYYRDQPTAKRPHGQIDIADPDDYLARMSEFAATPDYLVVLHHNMPWFDHFEVALDEAPWQRLDDNAFTWSARIGTQTLKVRAVNEVGVVGPVSSLTLRYGPAR